jgi:hypothetical protein
MIGPGGPGWRLDTQADRWKQLEETTAMGSGSSECIVV